MKFRRKYSRFHVSRRYCRTLDRLIDGCAEVRRLYEEGSIITAEKKYNKKLCYYYGTCHGLFKRRTEELEATPEIALDELEKIRNAFLGFYDIGEGYFKVDLTTQKEKILPIIDEAVNIFKQQQE